MARPLQLGNQFRVCLPGLLVLRLCGTLPFGKVGVNLFLVPQVKCQRAVHLFERQYRVRVNAPPPEGGGCGNGLQALFRPEAGRMFPAPSGL
jgi:hypothetical protein